jgi:hypothetical protein
MDAGPELARRAELLGRHRLEAILTGNAAAALQGAPITTIDVDFFFRRTPVNMKKLKALARDLGAQILQPYYPLSGLLRVMRDWDEFRVDFMTVINGVASFEGLRKRAKLVPLGAGNLLVAGLPDIIKSKKAAGRNQDLAVPGILEKTLKKPRITRKARLAALKRESDLALCDQIRKLLALPLDKRTNFLRKRVGIRMSCL